MLLFILFESVVILKYNDESKKYKLERSNDTIAMVNMVEFIDYKNSNKVQRVYYTTNYKYIINNNIAKYNSYFVIETDEFKIATYKISFLFQVKNNETTISSKRRLSLFNNFF
jgi:hypothetical protein